ncbi:MAG: MFS transporter [Proteobacteria bacterium]|nr:MFS transporter [Pseudomonadota bacterium]
MSKGEQDDGWRALLSPAALPAVAVLVGGVLLHSMNVLMLATVLPTVVEALGGAALMSWTSSAFLASSIVAATTTGYFASTLGARTVFSAGAILFGLGALACALAGSMEMIVAGRFVQGFGGGLLIAMAYVLVRVTFPERLWARGFALLSGAWSLAIVVGPLVGGLFARFGSWRGAFVAVTAIALALAVVSLRVLPRAAAGGEATRLPVLRALLVCAAIAAMSLMAVVTGSAAKAGLFVVALGFLAACLAVDRRATRPLLPTDAFAVGSVTGVGLWLCLLMCLAYSPLQIFVPIFLQGLHGLDALGAGYMVASASFGWTVVSLVVAGASAARSDRLLLAGPVALAVGLAGLALLLPVGPVLLLALPIALVGASMGGCWAFIAQRVMSGARSGEENLAASSVATVQQAGFALGAALAGAVANAAGLAHGVSREGLATAAVWVPASFAVAAMLAGVAAWRLVALARRRPAS